jgi:3-dehydroquinate synthase
MKRIRVPLGDRSYDIVIGRGVINNCGKELARLDIGKDAVVVTNARVKGLHGKTLRRSLEKSGFSVRFEIVPDSEKAKSISVVSRLLDRLNGYAPGKSVFLAAFGGGVIGDLTGFAAAIYKRGIPYVQIPTTLLAQVDSAIGGKTAVDLAAGKNLVGAFYQPRIVLSDISLMKSLPRRQIQTALAEIVKYGVIKDAVLFRFVENNYKKLFRGGGELEHVVARCSAIKAAIVARDEFDRTGARAVLNYGHTIGHAIETACGYSGTCTHGEAVAIGMLAASDISLSLGKISAADAGRIERLIKKIGLPSGIRGPKLPAVYAFHLHDKKFTGKTNRFVLPVRIGEARVFDGVPPGAIRNALRERVLS